jgi:hypothetical protein
VKLVTVIDAHALEDAALIAESNEFAIYDVGSDTYALVHRHAAVEWQAITISGDGLSRARHFGPGNSHVVPRRRSRSFKASASVGDRFAVPDDHRVTILMGV